jgi:hypothetical protein
MGHWWGKQRVIGFSSAGEATPAAPSQDIRLPALNRSFVLVMTGLCAAAVIAAIYAWVPTRVSRDVWILLAAVLGLAITLYGVGTRAWMLAAFGQLLVLGGVVNFIGALWEGRPDWFWTIGPVLVLGVLGRGAQLWFERKPGTSQQIREPILGLAAVYVWVGVLTSIWWLCEYTPAPHRAWVLIAAGAALFAVAVIRSRSEVLPFSAVYTVVGLLLLWLPQLGTPMVSWLNFGALLVILAQQRVARAQASRLSVPPEAHNTVIVCVAFSFLLLVSRWVLESQSGFYLTVSWSALALVLFVLGMSFRERIYRWAGLAVLGLALARVVLFDVWKLETLNRMLSFLALGIVLLVLGFVYNRYQERIRQWL